MNLRMLIMFCLIMAGSAGAEARSLENWQVSAGLHDACAIGDSGIFCWSSDKEVEINVPALKNPRQVSVGLGGHTCALDDNGVQCWGGNDFGETNVPPLKNPKQVSAGGVHSCAIDEEGVKCWGHPFDKGADIPMLKSPTQISAGYSHVCALDSVGVHCWGTDRKEVEVPPLKNPKQVSAGETHTCALDDNGVTCWGDNEYGEVNVPALKNPRQVSAGLNHTCALDDEGIKCWGRNEYKQNDIPPLDNPKQVSTASGYTCALDDVGVHCWGSSEYGAIEVPFEGIFFSLQLIQRTSPLSHSLFYETLASLEKTLSLEKSVEDRYLFYSLLKPTIEQTYSDFYQKVLIPRYQKYILDLKTKASLPEDFQKIRDSEKSRKMALKFIQAGLTVAFDFLSAPEKAKLQPMIQKIGTASADASDANIKKVLSAFKEKHSALEPLKNSEQSGFLVDVIDRAASWLAAKVN